jgi:hypothetical protein
MLFRIDPFLGGDMEKRCLGCEKRFSPHPAVRHQRYCHDPVCQKARKRKWQKEKLSRDGDYRANQAEAQRQWRSRNKDYWREYRRKNPGYTERNRLGQKERNRRWRSGLGIAKMDELIVELGVISGECDLGAEKA